MAGYNTKGQSRCNTTQSKTCVMSGLIEGCC